MLRDAWFIARKDVKYMLRRRETLLWTFVMPIIFFYFIGTITGGFGGSGPAKERLALLAPENSGFLLDQLTRRLEEQDYEVIRPTAADPAVYSRQLIVPGGFSDKVLEGEKVTLQFQRKGTDLGADYDQIRVSRAVYTLLADLVATTEGGEAPSRESFERLNGMPRALTLEVSPAGKRKQIPTGFEQAIPGTMVMFTLLVLLTSGAVLLVIERNEGLLKRLASTPISRRAVVLGKWGGKMALGMVQIGFALLAGRLLFGMDWGSAAPMVLVVLFAYAGFNASLGILLGSVARTEGQAAGLGALAANVLAALGGCWWPIEVTPSWMQSFSVFLPTGLTMDAMHKLVSFGSGAASTIPHVAILAVGAVAVGWLSTRVFRFQ